MTDDTAVRSAVRTERNAVTAPALAARAAERNGTPERHAQRNGTDTGTERVPVDLAVPDGTPNGTPARRNGTALAERNGTRTVPLTRTAARYVRTVARAVPRGSLSTIATNRRIQRIGVRPTDMLFVYRARRINRFLTSPAGIAPTVAATIPAAWIAVRHPEWADTIAVGGFGCFTGLTGWLGWGIADGMALWPHRTHLINELGYALRDPSILDLSPDIPAAKFVRWPKGFGEEGTEARIILPRGWSKSGDDRTAITRIVHDIGGYEGGDLNFHFVLRGRSSYVQITPRQQLIIPKLVRVTDTRTGEMLPEVIEQLELVRSGRPWLAVGRGDVQILGDLDGDAPHMGFSMPTGGGKSNQLKGVIAQEMHLGASVVILDLKRRSLKCFKGIEGVLYLREVEEIHSALIALYKEADDRNRLADDLGDDEEPPWQRHLVVMEEQNSTIDELNDYWLSIRKSDDPRVSPAVRAFRKLGNMGRQVKINLLSVFQKMTAQAAGGTVARDNFGMVVISKPKPAVWKMLADEISFPDTAGKPKGRSWYVCDGEAPEGQALLWTDRAARAWATSGESSEVREYDRRARGSRDPAHQGKRPATVAGTSPGIPAIDVTPLTVREPDPERLFTLREASSDEGFKVVRATYQTLRGKRSGSGRDPEFPEPDAIDGQKKLYRAETVQRWENNREVRV